MGMRIRGILLGALTISACSDAAGVDLVGTRPNISGLTPTTVVLNYPTALFIDGSGFGTSTTISIGGVPHSTISRSSDRLGIELTLGDVSDLGDLDVVVTNANSSGHIYSAHTALPVVLVPPGPLQLIPYGAAAGASLVDTVFAEYLEPTTTVSINGRAHASTFITSFGRYHNVLIPFDSAELAHPESLTVTLTTPGTGGGSDSAYFVASPPVVANPGFPFDITYCPNPQYYPATSMVEIAGSGSSPSTRSSGGACMPSMSWSPDGMRLAYLTTKDIPYGVCVPGDCRQYPMTTLSTRAMGQDSGTVVWSRSGVGISTAWSPDGSQIALVATQDSASSTLDIWIVNADGGGLRRLTTDGQNGDVAWSPDGQWIAYVHGRGTPVDAGGRSIFIVHPDGTGARRLTTDSLTKSWPAWSPDATRIVYHANTNAYFSGTQQQLDAMSGLYIVNVDGSGLTRLPSNAPDTHPTWSPDGAHIAFYSCRMQTPSGCGVYVANSDGSAVMRLSADIWPYPNPVWPLWRPTH